MGRSRGRCEVLSVREKSFVGADLQSVPIKSHMVRITTEQEGIKNPRQRWKIKRCPFEAPFLDMVIIISVILFVLPE